MVSNGCKTIDKLGVGVVGGIGGGTSGSPNVITCFGTEPASDPSYVCEVRVRVDAATIGEGLTDG